MTTRFSYVAPPSFLLATLAAAPTPASSGDSGATLDIHCSAIEALPGSIGRTIALHADLDGRRDVAAIVGDDVVVITGPDPTQYSRALGLSGVTAIASLAGGGLVADRILVAHDAGLAAISRNPVDVWSFKPIVQSIGGASWVDARSIVSLDVDGNGTLDVLGLDATGANLLCVTQGVGGAFTAQAPVSLGVELAHLVAAPWGASGTTLGAVLRTPSLPDDSVVVIDVDGNLLASYSPGGVVDDLAYIHDSVSGSVGLAALAAGALTVVRPGAVTEAPVSLSALAPSALDVADVNGDGRMDLLFNSTTSGETTVLFHQPPDLASFRADLASAMLVIDVLPDGGVMSGQIANPVGADFDRDGDVDVFQLVESTRSAVLRRGTPVAESALKPSIKQVFWSIVPGNSAAIFDVTLPAMPDGGAPDLLEIVLYTNEVGAAPDAPQSLRALVREDVTGYSVGDVVPVFVAFPGELGEESSVSLRGFDMDAAGTTVDDCGSESAKGYAYPPGSPRGTNNPPMPLPEEQLGRGKKIPPPPPTPVIV